MSSVGFIKLHRRLKDSDVFSDSELFHIFSFCLLEAEWEPVDKHIGNQIISLGVGQFITGRKKISRLTGIKESKIYRCLNTLEKLDIIEQQKTTKYSIISIVNWSKYQHTEQQTDNKSTTDEQQMNTIKEIKKKERKKTSSQKYSDDDVKCAEWIQGKINSIYEGKPAAADIRYDLIRKMRELDNYTHKQICQIFDWAHGDDFWRKNILSISKLREKAPDLKLRMLEEKGKSEETMSDEEVERKCQTAAKKHIKEGTTPTTTTHKRIHEIYKELINA